MAAELHIDRAIISPLDFVYTNVIATINLLNPDKYFWKQKLCHENAYGGICDEKRDYLFYHISTDEVYGSLGKEGLFKEAGPKIQTHHTLQVKQQVIIFEAT